MGPALTRSAEQVEQFTTVFPTLKKMSRDREDVLNEPS